MRRAGQEDDSRSEVREHAAFYLRGREAGTIVTYNTEYRRMVDFYRRKTGCVQCHCVSG